MNLTPVARAALIRGPEDISIEWLSEVLQRRVTGVEIRSMPGNWSSHFLLDVTFKGGAGCALRLKICLGDTFGRSEIDYYTKDYVGLADAPLVRCLDAQYDPGVGYHLLLDDLSATHHDRRSEPPTLAYGMAAAKALGRMHRHHWVSRPAPNMNELTRYFDHARPGLAPAEAATGRKLNDLMRRYEDRFIRRWSSSKGMSLIHGDLNPTNILTPKGTDWPVWFLDRQPFNWSLTYGVAVYDLAYYLVLWWPPELLRNCEQDLLQCWFDSVGAPDYSWDEAKGDWALSVEQCINVPLEWCSRAKTFESMRWLWEAQLSRVHDGIARVRDYP